MGTEWKDYNWDGPNIESSLSTLYQAAEGRAAEAIAWYGDHCKYKRHFARWLRVGAIFATAIAGLLPVWIQIYQNDATATQIAPGWATIWLGVAALCISLDKFFGFSSAWMRFIQADLDIRKRLDEFRFDWQLQLASAGAPDSTETLARMIVLARDLVLQIDTIQRRETDLWMGEFQDALKQVEQAVKQRESLPATGGVLITVSNGEKAEGAWSVTVDDSAVYSGYGKALAIAQLSPGTHKLRIDASVDQKNVQAETVVDVRPGLVTAAELSL